MKKKESILLLLLILLSVVVAVVVTLSYNEKPLSKRQEAMMQLTQEEARQLGRAQAAQDRLHEAREEAEESHLEPLIRGKSPRPDDSKLFDFSDLGEAFHQGFGKAAGEAVAPAVKLIAESALMAGKAGAIAIEAIPGAVEEAMKEVEEKERAEEEKKESNKDSKKDTRGRRD